MWFYRLFLFPNYNQSNLLSLGYLKSHKKALFKRKQVLSKKDIAFDDSGMMVG
jgi:hypothetical protein